MRSVTIGSALRDFFAEQGYEQRRTLESVFAVWDDVLGMPESWMARPLSIENGVLTVGVSTSTVASEVSLSAEHYLARLNGYFGTAAVREIRVRVLEPKRSGRRTPGSASDRSPQSDREEFDPDSVGVSRAELGWIDETTSHVGSPDLRAALGRLLLLYVKRRRWDEEQTTDQ